MSEKSKYKSINVVCKECGKEFSISPSEQKHFRNLGFALPKRCQACRQKRNLERRQEEERLQAQADAEKAAQRWEKEEAELKILLSTVPFRQIDFSEVQVPVPKQTLFIIGNGFDIMHGVRSSYWDFQKTLGRNSELRFHLETYLRAEDLWWNFEDSLSHLDAGMMLDVMDMWLDNFGAYRRDASASDFHGAIDTAMLPIYVLTDQLPRRFRAWVEALEANGSKPCQRIITSDAVYLNFNYTDFLETLYGVPHDKIKYIHGCRKKQKHHPKEKLILGHVPNVDYLKDYTPSPGMVPRYKNKYKAYLLESAIEIGTQQWITYYEEVFTKHTPEIIEENKDFFQGAADIKDIIVIGHSLSEVDYPYFKEIFRQNGDRAVWHIGYHSLDDMKRLIAFTGNLGIGADKVEIFRT